MIEAGKLAEAVSLTRPLSPVFILQELVYDAADENPSENYLQFFLRAADSRSETLDEVGMIDCARSLLITALAPLDDAFRRAYDLHLHSIERMRYLLEQNSREILFFRNTPDQELDVDTEQRMVSFAGVLRKWAR